MTGLNTTLCGTSILVHCATLALLLLCYYREFLIEKQQTVDMQGHRARKMIFQASSSIIFAILKNFDGNDVIAKPFTKLDEKNLSRILSHCLLSVIISNQFVKSKLQVNNLLTIIHQRLSSI